jgi:hypothetical protein
VGFSNCGCFRSANKAAPSNLRKIEEYPLKQEDAAAALQAILKRVALREKIGQFLTAERAVAVIRPSRDGASPKNRSAFEVNDIRGGRVTSSPWIESH